METESIKAETQRDADQSDRERVQRYFKKAQDYQKEHPEAALGEARKAAEAICKHILNKNKLNPGNATLELLLQRLTSEKLVPPIILLPLQTIQRYGNFGMHDQGPESDSITADHIQPCMLALSTVVKWFLDVYSPDANLELNPTVLGSAPQAQRPGGEPVARSATPGVSAPVDPMEALTPNAGRIADLDTASPRIAASDEIANGFWHRVHSALKRSGEKSRDLENEDWRKYLNEAWRRYFLDIHLASLLKRLIYIFVVFSVPYTLITWILPFYHAAAEQKNQEKRASFLKVTILPPEVVALGAKFRIGPEYPQRVPAGDVDGGFWFYSNEPIIPLPRDHRYKIEFSAVSGWQAPATQFIDSSSASQSFTYIRLPAETQPSYGTSITVMIHPADAANAGAGWKIDGPGEWKHSGDKIDLLVATNVSVIFSELPGWRKPSRIRVDADRSGAIPLEATYERKFADADSGPVPVSPDPATHQADFGYLSVAIEPTEAVQAGARWRVPGGEWQHSGAEIGPLVPIPVAVSFSSVPGWAKPESLEVGVKTGSNQIVGSYRPIDR